MAVKAMAPRIERTLKIIPRVHAQLLPFRKPNPTASHMRLKTTTIPPVIIPRPERMPPAAPISVEVEMRAESPIIAIPARSPNIPIKMANKASIVTPVGLGGFCICMSDARLVVSCLIRV